MKKIIPTLLLLAVTAMSAEHKVVFALSSGKVNVLQKRLIDQVVLLDEHYAKQGDTLKASVVIYGDAYRFFLKDPERSIYADDTLLKKLHAKLESELENLYKKYHVVFEICSMGMKKRDIDKSMIYSFVHPAFNKNAALIDWQNRGYAYIEVE